MLGSNAPKHDGMFAISRVLSWSSDLKLLDVGSRDTSSFPPLPPPQYLPRLTNFPGDDVYPRSPERGRRGNTPENADHDTNSLTHTSSLTIPKNRSTSNLLVQGSGSTNKDKGRIRFSFDGGAHDYDTLSR